MQEYERKQLLERVEREGATVGADIPETIEIQGEEIDLRTFVFEIKRRETVPSGERDRVEQAKKNLRRERLERLERIEEGDIAWDEGEELAGSIIGIDRALNALESLGPTDLEREQQVQQAQDRKRWMSFLKKALGQEDDASARRGTMTTNAELAARFEEFADLLEADDVEYKPRAYRRAAENIRAHPSPIADRVESGDHEAVENIEGVGDAISSKIIEYVETGDIDELEALREELPIDIADITRIEGVGPKTAGTLYRELGVQTLDDLETTAEAGEVQEVKGFGPKTEQNILENVEFARTVGQRQLLGEARPLADDVLALLESLDAVERCEVAGSIRRWRETIGDVDVLAATEANEAVIERFVEWESADDEIESGPEKASIRVGEIRVDLRVVVPAEFGSALQYFTGSKDHNVSLRNYAIDREMKLNEYGAFDVSEVPDAEDGQRVGDRVAGETEAGMYEALGLAWIPPELRTDRGEIAAAENGELPDLITRDDIRGDLHAHTEWSDGNTPIEAMVDAAAERGYDYFGIADHAEGPGIVGGMGLSDTEIHEQVEEIRAVGDEAEIEVFAGIEANVDAEGEIGLSDAVIEALDVIVASTHSALGQDAETATERLVRALENPAIDVLGHPSGRLLNERSGLDFDATALGRAAAEHDTALEVNSNPRRLDLWGSAVQAALEEGAAIAINTDAHQPSTLEYMRWGVHTARRGWAEPADAINTWELEALREFLTDERHQLPLPMRSLVDVMCGGLVSYLRMCNHDTAYAGDRGLEADDALLAVARNEGRTVVTRDVELAGRADESIRLESRDVEAQLAALDAAGIDLTLADEPRFCGRCNGPLEPVESTASTPAYVPDPAEFATWICRDCGQHFWRGSHWDRVAETLSRVRESAEDE